MRHQVALALFVGGLVLAPAADSDAAPRAKAAPPARRGGGESADRTPTAERKPARASRSGAPRAGAAKARRGAKRRVARVDEARRSRRDERSEQGAEVRTRPKHDATSSRAKALSILDRAISCPSDMVAVAGRVCVDRFEASLVDRSSSRAWSPFYPPSLDRAERVHAAYLGRAALARPERLEARMPLPPVPDFEIDPVAVSRSAALPQGYVNAHDAAQACAAAGKRLCTESEWVTACRGEQRRDFPYGDTYEQGTCNVFREHHPSMLLHGNASRYHDDPRNGLVVVEGRALLSSTGSSPRCASRWGDDAVFDMVGNLDEWIASDEGVFVGGFYSRGTRSGCAAKVSSHAPSYSDYSTGFRCCSDPRDERTGDAQAEPMAPPLAR